MDAFELIVGQLLSEEGLWVRHSVKVDLSKDEKRAMGKPSAPRPEIDLVAYSPVENKLWLIEVKSFLDSPGVHLDNVKAETTQQEGRYKLLTSTNYQNVVSGRLITDWCAKGHLPNDVRLAFGLVAGKVYQNKEAELKIYCDSKGWLFRGPSAIRQAVENLASKGYENNAVTIAAKILMR